jgi:F-type H+-transporting ATPase subunit b
VNINATIIGQMLAFAVFVFLTYRFVWPPIIAALEERTKKIADGLQSAEKAEKDLELAKQKAAQQIKEAKEQASVLIEQANKRAAQIVEEAKQQALLESERIKISAKTELESEVTHAREQLRKQVATLALVGAEKILAQSIDASAHSAMLEKLTAEL